MESQPKRTGRVGTRSIKGTVTGKKAAVTAFSLPNIAELIEYGEVTVGVLRPVGCDAIADDGHSSLAMLVCCAGETLIELLAWVDPAIAKALPEEVLTEEINPPPTDSTHR